MFTPLEDTRHTLACVFDVQSDQCILCPSELNKAVPLFQLSLTCNYLVIVCPSFGDSMWADVLRDCSISLVSLLIFLYRIQSIYTLTCDDTRI